MNKFWRIAWHEYSRHVMRRRFLLPLLSVPLLLGLMALLIVLAIWTQSDPRPIGYIDHSGLLANPIPQPAVKFPERTIPMAAYADEAAAKTDLEADKLQAYYILPQDYRQTGKAEQVYLESPNGYAVEQFNAFLAVNLLADQPAEIAGRVLDGGEVITETADGSRQAPENRIVNLILPFAAGILFIVAMSTSSGYLMQAVVEEKENRTMEIMVTSVSPGQLMGGKIVGDMAVGFTQMVVWSLFAALAVGIAKNYLPVLRDIHISTGTLLTLLAVMLPAFVMISGLMAAVGATVTEGSEGQQIMALFTIPIWLPYMLITLFIQNPGSPLAIALSLFPLTAPLTIALRMGFASVPTWQLVTSIVILVIAAVGAIWLAGRAFRMGMLRYGQRLRLVEVLSRKGA